MHTRTLRVLLICPTAVAAIPQYTHHLASALAARGHEVVLATGFGYEMSSYPRRYELLEVFDRFRPRPVRMMSFLRRIHAWRPDVIHFQGAQHPTTYLALRAILRAVTAAPAVYTPQDILPHYSRPGQEAAARRLYAGMKHVFLNAEENLDATTGLLAVDPHAITILPIADPVAFVRESGIEPTPPPVAPEKKVVLFFGQIQERKGLDTLLEAWPGVVREVPEAHLCIAGRPFVDMSPYRSTIERLGINASVLLQAEYADLARMAGFFRRAEIVVLPYRRAWNTGVVASAHGFGKPVIATAIPGLREFVDDGESGLLVPPDDPPALSRAIVRTLTDRALGRALRRGVARDAQRHTWPKIARTTEAVYRNVAGALP